MSERLDRPPESAEQEIKDDQALSGEQLLRSISMLPPDYHFSAEQKILFSTVSDEDDRSNFPISSDTQEKAIFTTFGLEYEDRRYPFTEQYQALVHRAVLSSIVKENDSYKAFVSYLESKNEEWQTLLKKRYEKQALSFATKSFNSIIDSKNSEEKKYSHVQTLWDKYENGPANKTSIKEIVSAAKKLYRKYSPEGRVINAANDYVISQGVSLRSQKASILRSQYPGYTEAKNSLDDKLEEYSGEINDAMNDYLDSVSMNEARNFRERADEHSQRIYELIINKVGNREIDVPIEEAQELLYNRLFLDFDITEDEKMRLQRIIDETKTRTINYCSSLIPEFSAYEDKPREFYKEEYERVSNEKVRLQSSREIFIDELSKRIAHSNIGKFKKNVAKIIFPNAAIKNIYLLPTGAVIKDSGGSLHSKNFSPLSEHILTLFADEATKKAWCTNWAKHAHDYDMPVRAFLKDDYEQKASNNTDSLDNELDELAKRFQIDYPEAISVTSGVVAESPQPNDYELLKSILPIVGGFIDEISLLSSEEEISLRSTRLEIISFLSGDREVEESILFNKGRKLKLRALEALLVNAGPEKREKVVVRLIPELGMAVFHSLDAAARSKFSQLVGPRANVSRTEFYNVYRKSVSDPEVRRRLALRTLFVNEFQNYLKGTSTMPEYFDSIKKKPVLSDDIMKLNEE